jgi:hypothetical protein
MVPGTEAHFRSVLDPERAGVLLKVLETSAQQARQLSAAIGFTQARTEPTVAFDLATQMLTAEFEPMSGVRRADSMGQILWVVDQTYALRVKRLDMTYSSTNHASGQQEAIAAQLPLAGMQPMIYLCAGVRYSARTGLPVDCVVVKHYPGTTDAQIPEWVVDLRDLAGGFGSDPIAPPLPFMPMPTRPQIKVRPGATRRPKTTKDDRGQLPAG